MVKSVWILGAVLLTSAGLVAGCSVDTGDGTIEATDSNEDTLKKAAASCELDVAGARDAQRAATAFFHFITSGNLVGPGNSATDADQAAYVRVGGMGRLGATEFTSFYPSSAIPAGVDTVRWNAARASADTAAETIKSMVEHEQISLENPHGGSICSQSAVLRAVYTAETPEWVLGTLETFVENAETLGYPEGLRRFLLIPARDSEVADSVAPRAESGGPTRRLVSFLDPEPARMFENLVGSNGTTGLATYVNSGAWTTAYRWVSVPQLGSVPPGAACSTADIVAGTEIYKSIQVFANGTRRCF